MYNHKQDIDILNEIKIELTRFTERFDKAIIEQSDTKNYSRRHIAGVKRSAYDLKNELTKLTQISKYKYEK